MKRGEMKAEARELSSQEVHMRHLPTRMHVAQRRVVHRVVPLALPLKRPAFYIFSIEHTRMAREQCSFFFFFRPECAPSHAERSTHFFFPKRKKKKLNLGSK